VVGPMININTISEKCTPVAVNHESMPPFWDSQYGMVLTSHRQGQALLEEVTCNNHGIGNCF
jgi:hypothetical protein